jgi:hypothetical protein
MKPRPVTFSCSRMPASSTACGGLRRLPCGRPPKQEHPIPPQVQRYGTEPSSIRAAARVGVTTPVKPRGRCAADHTQGQLTQPSCAVVNCAKTCTAAPHRTCSTASFHVKQYSHARLQVEPLHTAMRSKLLLISYLRGLPVVRRHTSPSDRQTPGTRCRCGYVGVQSPAAECWTLMHRARRRLGRRQAHLLPSSAGWHAWRSVAAISRLWSEHSTFRQAVSGPAPLGRCL